MPALQNLIIPAFRTFRELKRVKLAVAGDSLIIDNVPPLSYLLLELHVRRIGNIDIRLRYNDDAGARYTAKQISDNAGPTFQINDTSSRLFTSTTSPHNILYVFIHNHIDMEKVYRLVSASSGAAGAGNIGTVIEGMGKWVNTTERIRKIELLNTDTGDFDVETEMILSGHS